MELKQILERQRDFFRAGVSRNIVFRKQALRKLKKVIKAYEKDVFAALQADLGKSEAEAYATEIGMVYSELTYMIKHLDGLSRPKHIATPLQNFKGVSRIYREPYGVVLIIAPWNYPFQLAMVPLIGALAAGNCAVVKPSAYAPETSAVIGKIIEKTFGSNYVYTALCGRQDADALLEEKFDYIFFTGGKNAGQRIMEAAAKHLTPVTLELGGKSPCIVDETANIAVAARRIVWGKFLNCGQTCVAPDYVLVHRSVKEKLLAAMVRNIEALYGPEPIKSKDYGKIINEKHFLRLDGLLAGETPYYFGGADAKACKVGPILLDDVNWTSAVMAEEIFGPILPVMAFDDLKEVRKELVKRPKPLALYLFTENKAAEAYVLKTVSFGGGCINDTVMHLAGGSLPFGGIGESGMGAYHGKYSFRTFSHEKSVVKKSALIDVPLRYPPYSDRKLNLTRLFLK